MISFFSSRTLSLVCAAALSSAPLLANDPKKQPKMQPFPTPPEFVPVNGSHDLKLGTGYLEPALNRMGKELQIQNYGHKAAVLVHEDDRSPLATLSEDISLNLIQMRTRTADRAEQIKSDSQAGASAKGLAGVVLKQELESHCSESEFVIDMFGMLAPRRTVVDASKTKFASLVAVDPARDRFGNEIPFKFDFHLREASAEGAFRPKTQPNYRPAARVTMAAYGLSHSGGNVIRSHYLGVASYRRVSIRFSSREARAAWECEVQGTVPAEALGIPSAALPSGGVNVAVGSSLKRLIQSGSVSVEVSCRDIGIDRFLSFLHSNGAQEEVTAFLDVDRRLISESVSNSPEVADLLAQWVAKFRDIQWAFYRLQANFDDTELANALYVVAVGPDTPHSCVNRATIDATTMLPLVVNLEWNRLTNRQSNGEKKEKAKKM